jgi:small conductance mechanosensitive channel
MTQRTTYIAAALTAASIGLFAVASTGTAQEEPETPPLQDRAAELIALQSRIDALQVRYEAAEGADRELFYDQLRRRWQEHHGVLGQLVDELEKAREAGEADPGIAQLTRGAIERENEAARAWAERVAVSIAEARAGRPSTPPEELLDLEIKLSELNGSLNRGLAGVTDNYESAQTIGLDTGAGEVVLDSVLSERAAFFAASVELALERRSTLEARRSKTGVDTTAIDMKLAAVQERILGASATLGTMVELLGRRELETAQYEKLLLAATGDLGTEILDPEVVGGLFSDWWSAAVEWLADNTGTIVVRLITILFILFVAGVLARLARRAVTRLLGSRRIRVSDLLKGLVVGTASKLVWLLGLLVVLSVLGINIGPALAGLGIAGFVLGFALQDSLSNFAAGLMIMVYRPFDVGDLVTAAGVTGKVKDLTLVSTVITTLDNQLLVVPNGKIWGDVINNVTGQTMRRVDMVFGIGYDDDMRKAQRILKEILASHDLVLDDPEPVVRVHNLGDSSVDFICRPWCKTDDYWDVHWDVTQAAKERFDEEGVSIPFPQRDVHIYTAGAAPAGDAVEG